MMRLPPRSTRTDPLFPTRRSPDLIGVVAAETAREWAEQHELAEDAAAMRLTDQMALEHLYGKEPKGRKGYSGLLAFDFGCSESTVRTDRKSTRLNSSH